MQLTQPVDPFGEVNVHKRPDGSLDIIATILMVPDIEGARTGLALDASASMRKMYGVSNLVGGLFANKNTDAANVVQPVARLMSSYLARFSTDGKVNLIYWAVNPAGDAIEEIGRFSAEEAETVVIKGPGKHPWGRGTKLLPPVRYFVETAFREAPWAIGVLVTDGVIEDLPDVKNYCLQFARQIASGQRSFVKLVLIGVGEEVDEGQMEELDDMFEGSGLKDPHGEPIDIWDHKLASEMRKVEEIFAEVVSEDMIVAEKARLFDSSNRLVKDFTEGLPAMLRFTLPAGTTSFTLELPGGNVTQDITEALRKK